MMDCQIGFMEEIKKLTQDDFDLTLDQKCAQNEYTMAQSIAQDIVRLKYDYLCTFSTPMLQVCAQVNKTIPHIFGAVTDPYRMGVAKNQNEHQANVTGAATFQPVADTIKLMREIFPNAKRIGVVWNPAEACSEACVYKARDAVKLYNFTLVEKNVSSTSEVMDALKSVASENIDLFITMGDNTVNLALSTIADYLRQRKIPYFTNTFSDVDQGAFITLGADYSEVGRETARIASKVIHGADPKDVPINNFVPKKMGVNRELIQEYGLSIPEEFIKRAAKIKEKGIATSVEITLPTQTSQTKRKARLALFTFNENPLLSEAKAGFYDELKKRTGDEVEFTIDEKCAQNEFSMAQSIGQDIVRLKYDYVVTFATPILQAFSQVNKTIPHIFGYVTDPYRAGVAKSSAEHQANLTGVATFEPVENVIKMMRQILPNAKRIGMIWNPAEACSEACMIKAREVVKTCNFELVEATITNTNEVMDALKSMLNQNIDIFYTAGDNSVLLAKPVIGKFLRDHKIPYFSNDLPLKDQEDISLLSLGTDSTEIGRETARVAAKVILGANPKDVPIDDYIPEKLSVNPAYAKELGITIPEELMNRSIQAKKPATENISDSTKTSMVEKRKARVALLIFNENPIVKKCEWGFQDELKKITGDKIDYTFDEKCAQNDFPMIQTLAQDVVRLKYDYAITFSTPVLQAFAQVNKKIPHIFGYVTDPYHAGVAKSETEHQENLTGVASFDPVENLIKIMRLILPKAKRIGIIWNPAEACSEACMLKARVAAPANNFELVEKTVTGTSEIMDALKSMLNANVDIFYTAGDNTVLLAKPIIGKFLRDHKIPYFTNDIPIGQDDAMLSLGTDPEGIGREMARVAAKVILGANPKDVPIDNFIPEQLSVNPEFAKELGITIPEELIKRYAQAEKPAVDNTPESSKATPGEKRKARLALFTFNDNQLVKDCEAGFLDELKKLTGDKVEFTVDEKCAQNEFPMAQTIAQDIVRLKYDYMVSFSTPVSQAGAQINKTIPHIFGYVTDPYRAGLAKTPSDHQENLTGVATFEPVENTIKMMRQIFPKAKRIGMIWNPSESCSEACMIKAREMVKITGFELVEKTVTGTSEIVDAIKSMLSARIDIFYTAGDNTVLLAKSTIGKFLRDRKIPYFTNDLPLGQEEDTAFISLGTDIAEIGRETARITAKVVLGANPKDVPIDNFIPEKLSVNLAIAKELGVTVPEEILKSAGIEGKALPERPASEEKVPVSSLKPGGSQKKAAKGKN